MAERWLTIDEARPAAMRAILYLCCGTGSGARAFRQCGFAVIGVDIKRDRRFRGRFLLRDIRALTGPELIVHCANLGLVITGVFATSPCTEFSQCWSFNKTRQPDVAGGLELVCHCFRIAAELGVPIVLENVRGAQKYIGPASAHAGSFYFYGSSGLRLPHGRFVKGCWNTKAGYSKSKRHIRSPLLRGQIPFAITAAIAAHFQERAA